MRSRYLLADRASTVNGLQINAAIGLCSCRSKCNPPQFLQDWGTIITSLRCGVIPVHPQFLQVDFSMDLFVLIGIDGVHPSYFD